MVRMILMIKTMVIMRMTIPIIMMKKIIVMMLIMVITDACHSDFGDYFCDFGHLADFSVIGDFVKFC